MPDNVLTNPPEKRLPIAKILLGALLIPWRLRAPFGRALLVPILLQVLLLLAWQYAGEDLDRVSSWLLYAVHIALYTLVAVKCHRLMLLSAESEGKFALPSWSWRNSRFLGYLLMLGLLFWATTMALTMIVSFLVANLLPGGGTNEAISYIPLWMSILAYFPLARFSLVFPEAAIDGPGSWQLAWSRSAGNGLRLLVVVGALPLLVSSLFGLMYLAGGSLWVDIAYELLVNILVIVEVAALSLAYRELR